MIVHTFTFNHFGQNTYLLIDDTTKICALIDAGCFFEEEKKILVNYIQQHELVLEKLLFTHCHLDHAFGAHFIASQFPQIQIYGHKNENLFIDDAINQSLRFGIRMEQPPRITNFVSDGDVIEIGSEKMFAIHVPGHSPGSICYYNAHQQVVFSGDVLFAGSVGRSDLPGGNHDTLISGIVSKLMILPDDTIVYSGHGPSSTIKVERDTNPYF